MADDFTLKSKSTKRDAVVKSSKIITLSLDALYIPFVSFVYPNINDLPGVKTGVGYESL